MTAVERLRAWHKAGKGIVTMTNNGASWLVKAKSSLLDEPPVEAVAQELDVEQAAKTVVGQLEAAGVVLDA